MEMLSIIFLFIYKYKFLQVNHTNYIKCTILFEKIRKKAQRSFFIEKKIQFPRVKYYI